MRSRIVRTLTLLIFHLAVTSLVTASLVACQQKEDSLPIKPDELAKTTEDQASSAVKSTAEPVFPSHLKRVCQGDPIARAASYQTSTQTTHPVYLVYREQPTDTYEDQSQLGLLPNSWETEWKNLDEVELVLCVDKIQQQSVRKCEFKEAGQPTYVLEMYNTVYDAELREVKTGEVVADKEMAVSAADACPKMHMFTVEQKVDTLDADYTQAIYDFAKPYVEGVSEPDPD